MRSILASLALLVVTGFVSAEPPAKLARPADPVEAALVGVGYRRVPMKPVSPKDLSPCVEVLCGGHRLRLVVDSGSTLSIFNLATAKKLGLKPRADLAVTGLTGGGPLRLEPAAAPDLTFGDLTVGHFGIYVADLAAIRPAGEPADAKPDGVLGQHFLETSGAILDFAAQALYVIAPVDREWPKLKGAWACTGGTRDGKPLADADKWRWEFGGRGRVQITNAGQGTDAALTADVLPVDKENRALVLTREKTAKSAKLPFEQELIWVRYSSAGDTMKVAFLLAPKDTDIMADRVPLTVESKPGVVVLEFTRQPPEKK